MARGASVAGSSRRSQPAHDAYVTRTAFTQAIMQRVCLPEDEARQLYKDLMGSQDDAGYLDMVSDIDRQIAFCNFRLARMVFPLDRRWYIAIVNKVADTVAKAMGSSLTQSEVFFLKSVLDAIALSPDAENGIGYLGSVQANNLNFTQTQAQASQALGGSQAPPKLSMQGKEKLLPQLVADRWLAETPGRRGCYSIGVRSFLELKEFLLSLDLPEDTRAAWEKFL